MNVLIPIADGSEDIESVTLIDVLRRAGATVTVASVMPGRTQITAARGTVITADCHIDQLGISSFDLIAVPGGLPGAEHLRDCDTLTALLKAQAKAGHLYAAICAAPAVVLNHHGLITGRATAHPGFIDLLAEPVNDNVVIDGQCITSRGAGTSMDFALTLVEKLFNKDKRDELAEQMVVC